MTHATHNNMELHLNRVFSNQFVRFVEPDFRSLPSCLTFVNSDARRLLLCGNWSGQCSVVDVDKLMMFDNDLSSTRMSDVARDHCLLTNVELGKRKISRVQCFTSPHGESSAISIGDDSTLRDIDLNRLSVRNVVSHPIDLSVRDFALQKSPHCSQLMTTFSTHSLSLWDLRTFTIVSHTSSFENLQLKHVQFAGREQNLLCSLFDDNSLRIYDIRKQNTPLKIIKHNNDDDHNNNNNNVWSRAWQERSTFAELYSNNDNALNNVTTPFQLHSLTQWQGTTERTLPAANFVVDCEDRVWSSREASLACHSLRQQLQLVREFIVESDDSDHLTTSPLLTPDERNAIVGTASGELVCFSTDNDININSNHKSFRCKAHRGRVHAVDMHSSGILASFGADTRGIRVAFPFLLSSSTSMRPT